MIGVQREPQPGGEHVLGGLGELYVELHLLAVAAHEIGHGVARRELAVRDYYAPGTPAAVRRGILRAYGVRWVLDGHGSRQDPGLRAVARGPGDEVLYAVVP